MVSSPGDEQLDAGALDAGGDAGAPSDAGVDGDAGGPACSEDDECAATERCDDGTCVSRRGFTGHEAILNEVIGYGQDVTGGAGGTLIEVTNTNDTGSGSLREAIAITGPTWIYFTPGLTGTISAASLMYLRSDTTIDGRGANVAIGGHTLNVYQGIDNGADNIVLHNLRFTGGLPDNRNLVRLRFGTGFWLDHISFEAQPGDGKPLTTADAATDVTVSWCDFSQNQVSLIWLISSDNESPGDAAIRVTAHHNLFESTAERHPRARYATIHWLNNFVGDWGGYGSSISQEGFFLAENSIYEAGSRTTQAIVTRIGDWPNSGDPLEGNLRTVGNWWKNGTELPVERNPASVVDPPYRYDLEVADDALIARIRAGVGWQDTASPFE